MKKTLEKKCYVVYVINIYVVKTFKKSLGVAVMRLQDGSQRFPSSGVHTAVHPVPPCVWAGLCHPQAMIISHLQN